MSDRPQLFGPDNRLIEYEANPVEPIAAIGQVWDPFAQRSMMSEEMTPAATARVLLCGSLAERNKLLKRVLKRNAHFGGAWRNLALAISGLDYEAVARDKKTRKERSIAGKVRDAVQEQYAHVDVEACVGWLVAGEVANFGWAENKWDLSTKELLGWNLPDPVRQYWDRSTSALRILTRNAQSNGEALAPNMWAVHTSFLFPGGSLDGGCGEAMIWWDCFKSYTVADWLEFNAVYGKPWRLAFIRDPKDKATVIKAMRAMGVNAAGVFPAGVEVRLEKGAAVGAVETFEKLCARADDEVSILLTGHNLIQKSQSGNGTLAGEGAARVNEKLVRKAARGIMATLHRDTTMPMVTFQFGYDVAMEYAPILKLKYEPPVDVKARALALNLVNNLLRPLNKAIDGQQIQEEFNIAELVDIAPAAAPTQPGDNPDGAPPSEGDGDDPEAAGRRPRGGKVAARRVRGKVAAAAATRPGTPFQTHDDTARIGAAIAQPGYAAIAADLQDAIADADSIEEMKRAVWAGYGDIGTRGLASVTRDALTLANVQGRADVHAGS